jgi:uncharacterized protein
MSDQLDFPFTSYPHIAVLEQAECGDVIAQFQLAEQLRGSSPPDYQAALKWYSLAAQKGHRAAQNNLGTMYLNGLGVEQSATEAVSWYRRAAEQGEPIAQYNLGTRYRVGGGVPLDLNEAVRWFTLSAEQGYPDAMNDLGVAYRFGNGVQRDIFKAARLFVLAADADDVVALGNLTEISQEVDALARSGDPFAQFHIGLLHARGYGVPKDRPLAYAWLKLAVEGSNGEEESALIREGLIELHEGLSSTELERAGTQLAKLRELTATYGRLD